MLRFTLFGIPVTVHPWFWFTLAFIGGVLGANSMQALLRLALFVLAGFISILVHEMGHALTIRSFGAPTSITLQAFGGYAVSSSRFTRTQDFLVTAAGPAIQLALGAAVWGVVHWLPLVNHSLMYFLHILYIISFVWAILNLIPVLPMDGGRLLQALLGPQRTRLSYKISFAVAVFIGLASWLLLHDWLLPLFMAFMAHQSWQALKMTAR